MKTPLILVILIVCSTGSFACICFPPPVETAFERADEVFLGRLMKAEFHEDGEFVDESGEVRPAYLHSYCFKVHRKWKGSDASYLQLLQSMSCEYGFRYVGEDYLVFASAQYQPFRLKNENGDTPFFYAGLCSRTTDLLPASTEDSFFIQDTAALNRIAPQPILLKSSTESEFRFASWLIVGGALLVLCAAFIFTLRNR